MVSRQELLDDEWLIVRNSGEIPEIALHSALYFLTSDSEGPLLSLLPDELDMLRQAAAQRYQEIILRDLSFENHTLSIYRGLQRAIFNWQRFVAFCERQDTHCHSLQLITAEAFLRLVHTVTNTRDLTPVSHARIFNCQKSDLARFTTAIGLAPEQIPATIFTLCQK